MLGGFEEGARFGCFHGVFQLFEIQSSHHLVNQYLISTNYNSILLNRHKLAAVITGGASGIGRETALKFASKADRVVVADFNAAAGEETVNMIVDAGGEAMFVQTDVSAYEAVEALVEKAGAAYGRIDIMFNNAGIGRVTPVPDQEWSDYHAVINVNRHGVAHGIRVVAIAPGVSQVTTFVLTMAMVGLGLNVNLRALRTKATRPLIAMSSTSALLSVLSAWLV